MTGWGVAAPVRFTPALSDDYTTDADWFIPIANEAWKVIEPGFALDQWQHELIRRVLETYPPGHKRAGELRFRQVVISLARQNGKSVIGAMLGLYGLLRDLLGALVVGIASTAEQARIVYDRTMGVINGNPALRQLFAKLTETRGIRSKSGAVYEIKAAKAASLQGLAISLGVVDELHLLAAALWNALVSGSGARVNGLVVGISTAGDEHSELLLQLYETGEKALGGDPKLDRFGFFVWEAPESRVPEDRDELIAFLMAANPSLAEGRMDVENKLSDIATLPETEIIRYHLNRFVAAQAVFITAALWLLCQRASTEELPKGRPVFAIDRDPDWRYATIVAAVKDERGVIWTEVVASITNPTLGQLADVASQLQVHSPLSFIMDGYGLKDLGVELKKRGLPVRLGTQGDAINAASTLFSKIKQRRLRHDGSSLLALQMPRTIRKNVGEHFRISRKDSSIEIDAVIAESLAVLGAETITEQPLQIF